MDCEWQYPVEAWGTADGKTDQPKSEVTPTALPAAFQLLHLVILLGTLISLPYYSRSMHTLHTTARLVGRGLSYPATRLRFPLLNTR